MKSRVKYILYKILQFVLKVIWIFPIKKNKIIFMSHRGASQYSDSPKYISEYLEKKYPGRYELIWIVNDFQKFDFLRKRGIKLVKFNSIKEFYHLNTSAVCITNCGFRPYLVKRKDQLIINTLHGGGAYKSNISIENRKSLKSYLKYQKLRSSVFNLMLSSCKLGTQYTIRRDFQYFGEVLEKGLPRNDLLIKGDKEIVQKVRETYELKDEKLLLVAPTWRDSDRSDNINLNYSKLATALSQQYGGKWKILLRTHHLSSVNIDEYLDKSEDILMDASDYPDVQELLLTVNILITDFSSLLWDFAIQGKPILLYVPDLKRYEEERGFNVPLKDWGLYYAETQEELLDIISSHSTEDLQNASQEHLKIFGSYEHGNATESVCDYIKNVLDNN